LRQVALELVLRSLTVSASASKEVTFLDTKGHVKMSGFCMAAGFPRQRLNFEWGAFHTWLTREDERNS